MRWIPFILLPLMAPLGAQQPLPVIGYLNSTSPSTYAIYTDDFREGLLSTGYVEGVTVAIEYRWADGRNDRLPALAAELTRQQVAVIVATGAPVSVARAAEQQSGSRPKSRKSKFNSIRNPTPPRRFYLLGEESSERPTMPTPKLYRRQAEDCVELANEATELYAKTALLELAAEFRESAERLEHRMQEPKGQFCI